MLASAQRTKFSAGFGLNYGFSEWKHDFKVQGQPVSGSIPTGSTTYSASGTVARLDLYVLYNKPRISIGPLLRIRAHNSKPIFIGSTAVTMLQDRFTDYGGMIMSKVAGYKEASLQVLLQGGTFKMDDGNGLFKQKIFVTGGLRGTASMGRFDCFFALTYSYAQYQWPQISLQVSQTIDQLDRLMSVDISTGLVLKI